jgi:predicted metalloprotease
MRFGDQRESDNVEDRRGMGGRGVAIGGGGIGVVLLSLAIYLCQGGDLRSFLENLGSGTSTVEQPQPQQPSQPGKAPVSKDAQEKFTRQALVSMEDAWRQILPQQARRQYRAPKLVLFSGQVSSACGYASAATGPFYCPGDQKLYLDFDFFQELAREFKAPGDFAQAYVIAHEVGHHVQNLMGTMARAGNSNDASVRLELQADCYAGIWGNYAQKRGQMEAGDIEEGLRAAGAVGDDMIQKRTQGYVVPESFTHGSAKDRMMWFTRGFQSGDMRQCETFR